MQTESPNTTEANSTAKKGKMKIGAFITKIEETNSNIKKHIRRSITRTASTYFITLSVILPLFSFYFLFLLNTSNFT